MVKVRAVCAVCGCELPPGWPVIHTDEGWAHYFRNWCEPEPCPEIRTLCEWLTSCGMELHRDYTYNSAAALKVSMLRADIGVRPVAANSKDVDDDDN